MISVLQCIHDYSAVCSGAVQYYLQTSVYVTAVQCSAVQCSAVCSVQCSAVCSDTVHFSAVYIYDCSAVQCSAMQCSVVIHCSAVCSGAFIRCPAGQEGKVRGSSITANVSAPENKGTGLGWRPNNRHIFMSVHNLVIVPILQHC